MGAWLGAAVGAVVHALQWAGQVSRVELEPHPSESTTAAQPGGSNTPGPHDGVGRLVGTAVGLRVGTGVGIRVGLAVGCRDGVVVGSAVGDTVGLCDGADDGLSVGTDVGL